MTQRSVHTLSPAQKEAIQWLSRLQQGHCSDKVRQRFQRWLQASEENAQAFKMVEHFWNEYADLQSLGHVELQQARTFAKECQQLKRRRNTGLCMVVLLFTYLTSYPQSILQFAANHYRTEKGKTLNLKLSDGSQIELNTDSSMKVVDIFGWRKIWLERGEAWFDIHHDPNHSLCIETLQGRLQDIGTRFDVLTEPNKTTVTVAEGQVEIVTSQARAILEKNQQGILESSGRLQHNDLTEHEAIAAWRSGILIFQNQTLADVLQQLNRYHQVEFSISHTELRQKRISGRFSTQDLPATLHTLALGMNLQITQIQPNRYSIRQR